MAGEVTVPPITENKSFGSELRPSCVTFDQKSGRAHFIYETHNGVAFTGRFFEIIVDASGTTYKHVDGTLETQANPKIDAVAVQAIVDWAKLKLVAEAKAP